MAKKSVAGTIADPTIQFSTLTIDDQTFKLAYSFQSLALAEQAAGCNLLRGIQSLYDLSALHLRGLLYAALTVGQPEMTIESASNLIRLDTINQITEALSEAYTLSLPAKKKEEAEPEKTLQPTPTFGTVAGV